MGDREGGSQQWAPYLGLEESWVESARFSVCNYSSITAPLASGALGDNLGKFAWIPPKEKETEPSGTCSPIIVPQDLKCLQISFGVSAR